MQKYNMIGNAVDHVIGTCVAATQIDKPKGAEQEKMQLRAIESIHAAGFVLKTFFEDVHRIANSLEKLAKSDGIPGH